MGFLRKSAGWTTRALGSYGLACIVLVLLTILTLLGTLEQAHASLYDVQRKYFESLLVVTDSPPLVLPGARLLLTVLFANLMVGGMLRLRRSWSRLGVFVIHVGIALLLFGGLVEYSTSRKGHLTLFEGESGSTFQSYFEWEVVVLEPSAEGSMREYVIPHARFAELQPGERVRMTSEWLPFDVELGEFVPNCRPRPDGSARAIEGFVLEPRPPEMQAEANIAGLTVSLVAPDRSETRTGLLWGVQAAPWTVVADGRPFAIDLRRRTWELPFEVRLDDFTRELHPGTGMASSFYSEVGCIEGGVRRDVTISMNEPLRRQGYTLYQASWGPSSARPGEPLFSTFAVVQNPADRIPLWACTIIAVGLLVHFIPKLARHVRAQAARSRA